MVVYKVGEWLINKYTKQLGEVIELIEFPDQDHVIVVKYIGTMYYRSETKPMSKINRLWTKAPMAQLLYGTKIQRR